MQGGATTITRVRFRREAWCEQVATAALASSRPLGVKVGPVGCQRQDAKASYRPRAGRAGYWRRDARGRVRRPGVVVLVVLARSFQHPARALPPAGLLVQLAQSPHRQRAASCRHRRVQLW
jgi:hypothetical protein